MLCAVRLRVVLKGWLLFVRHAKRKTITIINPVWKMRLVNLKDRVRLIKSLCLP